MSSIKETILAVCQEQKNLLGNDDFYGEGYIPPAKAGNLAQSCRDAGVEVRDSSFLAIIDCTVWGSCKNGMAVAEGGIYTRNDWTADCKSGFVSWEELMADGNVRKGSAFEVMFLESKPIGIDLSGSDCKRDDCIVFVDRLRSAMASVLGSGAGGDSAPTPETASAVFRTPWICDWCGRHNAGGAQCAGCGAPMAKHP